MSVSGNLAPTVLIVDDYPSLLAWAARAFTRAGWRVFTANCSAEAVDAWQSAQRSGVHVHLLVTDLELPDQDGESLARDLRALDPSLFVIAITAHADRADGWNSALLHRTAFFQKPMLAAELLSAANASLDLAPVGDTGLSPATRFGAAIRIV